MRVHILGDLCRVVDAPKLRVASLCHLIRVGISRLCLQLRRQVRHRVIFFVQLIKAQLLKVVLIDALLPQLLELIHDFNLGHGSFLLRLVPQRHQLLLLSSQHFRPLCVELYLLQDKLLLVFTSTLDASNVFLPFLPFNLDDFRLQHLLVFFLLVRPLHDFFFVMPRLEEKLLLVLSTSLVGDPNVLQVL